MEIIPPVSTFLIAKQIPHRVFTHPTKLESLEQAARERNQKPDQVVRSILFRLAKERYAMVLITGPRQIAWPALRKFFGVSRLTMASPVEVLTVTGYPIGAVSPFGIPADIPILIDRSVFLQEEVSIGSGWRGTTIFIQTTDLRSALGLVTEVDLVG